MEIIKSISKIGNSLGVILPLEMIEELGISKKSRIRLISENGFITIRPTEGREVKIMRAAAKYLQKYKKDFKKLAR